MFSPRLIISPFNNNKSDITTIQSPVSSSSSMYRRPETIRFSSQSSMKHDANGCCSCGTVAGHYMSALRYAVSSDEPIACDKQLFDLIWQMTNLILSHRETSKYQYLSWFELVTMELWEFAKRLKDESLECDFHVSIHNMSIDSGDSSSDEYTSIHNDMEENYRRSIRITIYNCRASVYEQSNQYSQAILYYRKCASVRPTPFEPQQYLQQSALLAIQRLSKLSPPTPVLKKRPTASSTKSSDSFSTTSTSSSISSKSSLSSCSQCSTEKKTMPVCAKCKITPYCSVRCMKSHQSIHASICSRKS